MTASGSLWPHVRVSSLLLDPSLNVQVPTVCRWRQCTGMSGARRSRRGWRGASRQASVLGRRQGRPWLVARPALTSSSAAAFSVSSSSSSLSLVVVSPRCSSMSRGVSPLDCLVVFLHLHHLIDVGVMMQCGVSLSLWCARRVYIYIYINRRSRRTSLRYTHTGIYYASCGSLSYPTRRTMCSLVQECTCKMRGVVLSVCVVHPSRYVCTVYVPMRADTHHVQLVHFTMYDGTWHNIVRRRCTSRMYIVHVRCASSYKIVGVDNVVVQKYTYYVPERERERPL